VFGGFTPAICTALIHSTGNKAIPGAWLTVGAVMALVATLVLVGSRSPARLKAGSRRTLPSSQQPVI
jgi:hypothetical protein